MRLKPALIVVILAWTLASLGCAASSHPADAPAPEAPASFSLRGQDGQVQFDFTVHPPVELSHHLQSDEICYLTVGDAVIMCTEDGSFLLFGPEDGVTLVKDNPASRLRPGSDDPADQEWIDLFSTVFLIAASVDRLPDALCDYLDDPGPHHRQASALARKILSNNGATLPAAVRGNTFAVTLRLTVSGRDKLSDALQSDDVQTGILRVGNKLVRRRDNPLTKPLP